MQDTEMEKRSDKRKKPISYHTFLFPFSFDKSNNNPRKRFEELFLAPLTDKKSDGWMPVIDPREWVASLGSDINDSEKKLYGEYHYFNAAARELIIASAHKNDSTVWNYRYWFADQKKTDNTNPIEYSIIRSERKYDLKVNGIKLKLFSTGVGILIFELENYSYPDPDDVRRINEYGRRIYIP